MRHLLVAASLLLLSPLSMAASFDCAKATTPLEKLICNTPELNEEDTRLGEAYSTAIKTFPFPSLIKEEQKGWLSGFRQCATVVKCGAMLKQRTKELSTYKNASVYADYEGKKFSPQQGTIIIWEQEGNKIARLFGNWMPDGYMDPNKMKGYPFDGFICDSEIPLLKKGSLYITKDGNASDDFSLNIEASKVVMKGSVMCNARCGFGPGVYKKVSTN